MFICMKPPTFFAYFLPTFVCLFCLSTTSVRAEQYPTGSHTITSPQGLFTVNAGYVSHFNAHDFFVYSFMFRPAGSKDWHQVPRVDKEDDPNMLFTVQTKHTADRVLFDARVVSAKGKIQLITANLNTGETLADSGPVTLITYDLVKLDDYERWVFLRSSVKKIEPKTSVESLLKNATLPLDKK